MTATDMVHFSKCILPVSTQQSPKTALLESLTVKKMHFKTCASQI